MSILPDFIVSLVQPYLQPLLCWLSDYVYGRLCQCESDHLLIKLHRRLDLRPLEQACQAFHHASGPGAPPTHLAPRLVRALLVKYLFNCSLREAELQIRFHLVVKWFVGYALFETGPDHTTLERFEQWVARGQPRLFFDTVLNQIDTDFPEWRSSTQIGDTFALQADAARETLCALIRHTCRRLLAQLNKAAPERLPRVLAQLNTTALFGAPDDLGDGRLSSPQYQARLQTVVTHARYCAQLIRAQLEAAPPLDSAQRAETLQWLKYLDKILADEVALTFPAEAPSPGSAAALDPSDVTPALGAGASVALARPLTPSDPPPQAPTQVLELDSKHKGDFRLGSATDPEATFRIHGANKNDLGYNAEIITDGRLVREIHVATGAQPDAVALPALLQAQLHYHGFCPNKLIYDRAASRGKTRALVEQATTGRTQLVAHLPAALHGPDRFGPEDFVLSEDASRLTCPNGQSSTISYPNNNYDGRVFKFIAGQCRACPVWTRCRGDHSGPKSRREVFVSDYRPQVEAARAYNQTPDFLADMKVRPLVERIIAGLVRYNGARRACRRGLAYADFQAKMCATAFNLKTWLAVTLERVRTPAQKLLSAPRPDSA